MTYPSLIDHINALPPLLSTQDLVELGIFKSSCAARCQRKRNIGPRYIRLSKKVISYPREDVIKFLAERGYFAETRNE
jgi:hypothetical protein